MCIVLFLCEIWALCEFICSSQLCNRSASRHITPISTVWAFSIQQQQSGSRAVAADSMHSWTSLHHWWYLENVLIVQPFQISLPVPVFFLLVCLMQSVAEGWCCMGGDPVLILWGLELPGRLDDTGIGHSFCCPSPQPFPCSLAWTSQDASLHSQPHPWLQADGGRTVAAFYRNGCKETFFPPEKRCPYFRLCF